MVRGSNVKQAFIEKSILLIKANKVVTALDEKKLKYGLECFYNMVTKTVVMIILAFIFLLYKIAGFKSRKKRL